MTKPSLFVVFEGQTEGELEADWSRAFDEPKRKARPSSRADRKYISRAENGNINWKIALGVCPICNTGTLKPTAPRPDALRNSTGPEKGAFPLRPRFNAACPPSPAADILNGHTAGTSTTAIRIRANTRAIPPRPRPSPRRFRARMGSVLIEADRGRFSGVARSTGMDS